MLVWSLLPAGRSTSSDCWRKPFLWRRRLFRQTIWYLHLHSLREHSSSECILVTPFAYKTAKDVIWTDLKWQFRLAWVRTSGPVVTHVVQLGSSRVETSSEQMWIARPDGFQLEPNTSLVAPTCQTDRMARILMRAWYSLRGNQSTLRYHQSWDLNDIRICQIFRQTLIYSFVYILVYKFHVSIFDFYS